MDGDGSCVGAVCAFLMSLPRRAMSEMGLAICCLMCDAVDEAGSVRCKSCIGMHGKVRERIAKGDDGVHGEVLQGYVRLLASHEGPRDPPTQDEINALFEAAKARTKGSLIRDVANQSQWKYEAPSPESARAMSDEFTEVDDEYVGKRTVPSRQIEVVDRSDRVGEDVALTDRVSANVAVQDAPDDLKDLLADVHVAKRKAKRDELSDAMEGLDDLLDE